MIGQSLSSGSASRAVWAVTISLGAGLAAWIWLRSSGSTAPAGEAADGVEIVEPRGTLEIAPERFVWRPVTGAVSYEVRIADDDTVWPLFVRRTESALLMLSPGESRALAPGRVHVWEVAARDADDRTIASGSAQFRVRAGTR